MSFQPFWFDQAMQYERQMGAQHKPSNDTRSPSGKQIDIAIVGGGFTGLWTAIQVKQQRPEKRIAIIEKDLCGQGASGRNGGAMLTWSSKYLSLKQRFGEEQAAFFVQTSEQAVHDIQAFTKTHHIECDLRVDGVYMSASNRAQLGILEPCMQALTQAGLNHWRNVPLEQMARTGSRQHLAALYSPHAGSVQPALLVRGLKRVAHEMGVDIFEHCQYLNHQGNAPITLNFQHQGSQGALLCNQLVFAVNAWLSTLVPSFSRKVVLVSSDMMITPQIPARIEALGLNHGASVIDSRIFVNYYRTTSDGRLMLGKGGNFFSFANKVRQRFDAPSSYQTILSNSLAYFFGHNQVDIERTWTGPSDRSVSGFPFFGEMNNQSQVFYGSGYSGNGVVQSYLGGKILSSLLLNKQDKWQTCALVNQQLAQFPVEPIRTLGAYMVRNAIRRKEYREDNNRPVNKLDAYLARFSGSAAKADTLS